MKKEEESVYEISKILDIAVETWNLTTAPVPISLAT